MVAGALLCGWACSDDAVEGNTDAAAAGAAEVGIADSIAAIPDGAEPLDAPVVDTSAPELPLVCPGGPDCPCVENEECDISMCIDTPAGKRCARACVETCSADFKCTSVGSSSDSVTICVPRWGMLCDPCADNVTCQVPGLAGTACLDHGVIGSFCGGPCDAKVGCPTGYACQDATTIGGLPGKYCVRNEDAGSCPCSPHATDAKLATTCGASKHDDLGRLLEVCEGSRKCGADGLGPCVAVPGGLCEDVLCKGKADATACDDGDPCTLGDACLAGHCVGDNLCECKMTADCAAGEDGDLCNGTLYCDKATQPWKCAVNPATVVTCNTTGDTTCSKNLCQAATGQCLATAEVEGSKCDDNQPCTVGDSCKGGKCTPGDDLCQCKKAADCAKYEDEDQCNGTLYCDFEQQPWKCKINPATLVSCSVTKDVACAKNTCGPTTGKCSYGSVADGLPCEDGDVCTNGDSCQAGACTPGKAVCNCTSDADCLLQDDGNICNGILYCNMVQKVCKVNPGTVVHCPNVDDKACLRNTCQPKTGVCVMTAVFDNQPCDDDNACTQGETCTGSICEATALANTCTCTSDNDCAGKEDGDLCNGTLYCHKQSGSCLLNPASLVKCPTVDDGPCIKRQCAPKTGLCALNPLPDGAPCQDDNPCTPNDACKGGKCAAGDANICPCKELADCAKLEDGDLCNGTLYCDTGGGSAGCTLNPGSVVQCDTSGTTTCAINLCQPKTGLCAMTPQNLGAACDDANPCTKDEVCGGGACKSPGPGCDDGDACTEDACDGKTKACVHNKKDCDDGNICTADVCVGAGVCNHPAASGGCSDGDPCTEGDACAGGKCGAGKAKDCDDGQTCTEDACGALGKCGHLATGGACDDGDVCSIDDKCAGGVCLPGAATSCDDGEVCTLDGCDKVKGCVATAKAGDCDDGDPCTEKDACVGGKCAAGVPAKCDDGDPCTEQSKCVGGKCVGGQPVACDDKEFCTDDACVAMVGCKFVPNTAPCDDGSECTEEDACKAGECLSGAALDCGDGDPCTDDVCDPTVGCKKAPTTESCDDGDACTKGDTCAGGKCAAGAKIDCDDANGCTVDSCSKLVGCKNVGMSGDPCDDADPCTGADACADGKCVGLPEKSTLDCDDGNVCTDDGCQQGKGCLFVNNIGGCTDGNACTSGDICVGGSCKPGKQGCPDETRPCHVSACDVKLGQCVQSVVPDGTSCGGIRGSCVAGACSWAEPGPQWALVPAGTLNMGCDAMLAGGCAKHLIPRHEVAITSSFWLSVHEVTASEYSLCMAAGKCTAPETTGKNDKKCGSSNKQNNWTTAGPKSGREKHPVNCVSWSQATQYCGWVGGYLPTEAQWELAARGRCQDNGAGATCGQTRLYPWGNDKSVCKKHTVYGYGGQGCGLGTTWAVGAGSPDGAGPYGHRDLVGNVWEWVWDYWDAEFYAKKKATEPDAKNSVPSADRVIRGGGFEDGTYSSVYSDSRAAGKGANSVDRGFRCARVFDICDDGESCTADSKGKDGKCVHVAVNDGIACDDGSKCTQSDTCTAGKCVPGAPQVCPAAVLPCQVTACDAETAQCSIKAAPDGVSCADGQGQCQTGGCAQTAAQGRAMIHVPAGAFWMGCNASKDSACEADEKPQTEVTLPAYWLDKYEVTVADYGLCVAAGKCAAPPGGLGYPNWGVSGREQHPVNNVNWPKARAYCQWLGAGYDLPTQKQWEMAARGSCEHNGGSAACKAGMRIYPWGDQSPNCEYAVYNAGGPGCGKGATWPVGSKPKGVSPYGLYDMAGNIGEWTLVPTGDYGVTRGGNWSWWAAQLRASDRDVRLKTSHDHKYGLRCARPFVVCDDQDPCTADSKDKDSKCVHVAAVDGLACDDGSMCTVTDTCKTGKCVAGSAKNCDDANVCTDDSCDKDKGCQFGNNTSGCSDDNACTTGDLCADGVCNAGAAKSCPIPLPCRVAACDSKTGDCVVTVAADGVACAEGQGQCLAGICATAAAQGRKMVYVPAGSFWMGCNATKDGACGGDEKPQHEVVLSSYWLDMYEVTVADYRKCKLAGKCTTLQGGNSSSTNWNKAGREQHPHNSVMWTEARAYCQWLGAGFDLPSEAQWEKGARGGCEHNGGASGCKAGMRTYPWGESSPTCELAVFSYQGAGCGQGSTWAVGSKPKGVGPYGAHDMAGNVSEWILDTYGSGYYGTSPKNDPVNSKSSSLRVYRDGGLHRSAAEQRSSNRSYYADSGYGGDRGFRCAKSFDPCDDNDPCTADSKDKDSKCVHVAAADGLACDDGSLCTVTDTCKTGKCVPGGAKDCDDANVCTDDSCDKDKGCQTVNNTAGCSDDNACTTPDTCSAGTCKAGTPKSCPAPLPCQVATCDSKTGDCGVTSAPDGSPCADGQGTCTAGDCVRVAAQGRKMVHVPGGSFWMGCNAIKDNQCGAQVGENPQHEVVLSAYWIDVHEVTAADFARCRAASQCAGAFAGEGDFTSNLYLAGRDQHPLNCVPWELARDYCKWLGASYDLPTEAQWEKAARGGCEHNGGVAGCKAAMRTYPWGEPMPECVYAVGGCDLDKTSPVGTKPKGVSPYGAHDMAGNAWEWVVDRYDEAYYKTSPKDDPTNQGPVPHVMRGGSWDGPKWSFRSSSRRQGSAGTMPTSRGFRCARQYDACDDNDPCTVDSKTDGKCVHTDAKSGQSCDDGSACTYGETCSKGKCGSGKNKDCNDGNACTDDSCDKDKGCLFANNTGSCSDNDACTVGDVCSAGKCIVGKATDCDDANTCTTESCNTSSGMCDVVWLAAPVCDGLLWAGRCYRAFADAKDWQASEQACVAWGGHLASIDTPAEHAIAMKARDIADPIARGQAWLGLSDVAKEGTFVWTDGSSFRYGHWITGNPDAANAAEDCVGTWHGDRWSDTECDAKLVRICEKAAVIAACSDGNLCTAGAHCEQGMCVAGDGLVAKCIDDDICTLDTCAAKDGQCSHQANSCDDGNPCTTESCTVGTGCVHVAKADTCDGKLWRGHCYKAFKANLTWPQARSKCQIWGGDLTSICDADEKAVVYGLQMALGNYDAWIGLWDKPKDNKWTWVDGSDCSYRAWGDGCPSNASVEYYAEMRKQGFWNDHGGSEVHELYVCEKALKANCDGDNCTAEEACVDGGCVVFAATHCDDGNPCTTDACNSSGVCSHTPLGDGVACVAGGVCASTVCVISKPTLLPKSCLAVQQADANAKSGWYWLEPDGAAGGKAPGLFYCDQDGDGGGWTLVWSNIIGGLGKPVTNLKWADAINTAPRYGGETAGGLDAFTTYTGLSYWPLLATAGLLRYTWAPGPGQAVDQSYKCNFTLDASADYKITFDKCQQLVGSVVPGLVSHHHGAPFSTIDKENDVHVTEKCAQLFSGTPWWYVGCYQGSINGGGEFNGYAEYNGASWQQGAVAWGKAGGTGAGNGWIWVR